MRLAILAGYWQAPDRNHALAISWCFYRVHAGFDFPVLSQQLRVIALYQLRGCLRKQLARGLADDVASRQAVKTFGGLIGEDIPQTSSVLGNDRFRYVFNDRQQKLLGALKDSLNPALLGKIFMGRHPSSTRHRPFRNANNTAIGEFYIVDRWFSLDDSGLDLGDIIIDVARKQTNLGPVFHDILERTPGLRYFHRQAIHFLIPTVDHENVRLRVKHDQTLWHIVDRRIQLPLFGVVLVVEAVAFSESCVTFPRGGKLKFLKLQNTTHRVLEILNRVSEASDLIPAIYMRNDEFQLPCSDPVGRMRDFQQRGDDRVSNDERHEARKHQGAAAKNDQIPRGELTLLTQLRNMPGTLGINPGEGFEVFVECSAHTAIGVVVAPFAARGRVNLVCTPDEFVSEIDKLSYASLDNGELFGVVGADRLLPFRHDGIELPVAFQKCVAVPFHYHAFRRHIDSA